MIFLYQKRAIAGGFPWKAASEIENTTESLIWCVLRILRREVGLSERSWGWDAVSTRASAVGSSEAGISTLELSAIVLGVLDLYTLTLTNHLRGGMTLSKAAFFS